jgi:hypothetical protein
MTYFLKMPVLFAAVLAAGSAFAQDPGYRPQGGCPMMGQGMMCQGMMGQGMMGRPMHEGMMGQGTQGGMMGPMGGMMSGMMSGSGNTGLHVMMMIAAADTDGDQMVSFDEVMAVHKRMFGMIDENRDGKVDQAEMKAILTGDAKGH